VSTNPAGSAFNSPGFHPSYGMDYMEDEDEDRDEDEDDFIVSALMFGQEDSSIGAGNHHRRLGEQRGEDERVGGSPGRDLTPFPRLRPQTHNRAYRPNARYIPHHQRRQRTGRGGEEEENNQQDEDDLSFSGIRMARYPSLFRRQNYPLLR